MIRSWGLMLTLVEKEGKVVASQEAREKERYPKRKTPSAVSVGCGRLGRLAGWHRLDREPEKTGL